LRSCLALYSPERRAEGGAPHSAIVDARMRRYPAFIVDNRA